MLASSTLVYTFLLPQIVTNKQLLFNKKCVYFSVKLFWIFFYPNRAGHFGKMYAQIYAQFMHRRYEPQKKVII